MEGARLVSLLLIELSWKLFFYSDTWLSLDTCSIFSQNFFAFFFNLKRAFIKFYHAMVINMAVLFWWSLIILILLKL